MLRPSSAQARGIAVARILLADDDRDVRTLLAAIIEPDGHELHEASDGAMALAMLLAEEFDLVLLDVMMPNLDGREVLTQLREAGRTTAVIIVSAEIDPRGLRLEAKMGAIDRIFKPFMARDVLETVNQVLGRTPEEHQARLEMLARAAEAYGSAEDIRPTE